jgi:hypothetical protein
MRYARRGAVVANLARQRNEDFERTRAETRRVIKVTHAAVSVSRQVLRNSLRGRI